MVHYFLVGVYCDLNSKASLISIFIHCGLVLAICIEVVSNVMALIKVLKIDTVGSAQDFWKNHLAGRSDQDKRTALNADICDD
jgi:hypothetical protein